MTEKRFIIRPQRKKDDNEIAIIDFKKSKPMVTIREIVKCLNELHEENVTLKKKIKNMEKKND